VKAASDIYAPVDGEIVAFNEALSDMPQMLNETPYDTWIFKLKTNEPIDGLLDAAAYEDIVSAAK
jgi:glycine cleavage system H protein